MELSENLQPQVRRLPVYQPGKPVELVAREFGLDPDQIIKLASNENPLGASPRALAAARDSMDEVALYPDNSAWFLTQKLAKQFDLAADQFVMAAGSNEIFYRLADLFIGPGTSAVMGAHAFISYKIATILAGGDAIEVPMPGYSHDLNAMRAAVREDTRIVFLPNPNNPTGDLLPAADVIEFARSLPPGVVFCYDEAYAEYQEDPLDLRPLIAEGLPIVCTRTFSKIFGLAGLRIGYGYTTREIATWLNAIRPPFNTSLPAQAAAAEALDDHEWIRHCRSENQKGMVQLEKGFTELGLPYVPSYGNFLLVQFQDPDTVFHELQCLGIIVRPVKGYNLPSHLRVSVGTEPQNARLLGALRKLLNP